MGASCFVCPVWSGASHRLVRMPSGRPGGSSSTQSLRCSMTPMTIEAGARCPSAHVTPLASPRAVARGSVTLWPAVGRGGLSVHGCDFENDVERCIARQPR